MANILIADDSIVMRKNLKSILTRQGHNIVAEASNGQQAYLLYRKSAVDIVTMDITMPVMDGIESLKKIKEKDPEAKVIIISALDQKRMVFQALELGAKYYIIKPVTEDKIENAINKVLNAAEEKAHLEEKAALEVKEAPKSEKIEEVPQVPFSIDNKEGTFIINLNEALNDVNINTLRMTIDSFLFIKPLKVVFNVASSVKYSKEVIASLVEISKKIKNAQGEFTVEGEAEIKNAFI